MAVVAVTVEAVEVVVIKEVDVVTVQVAVAAVVTVVVVFVVERKKYPVPKMRMKRLYYTNAWKFILMLRISLFHFKM